MKYGYVGADNVVGQIFDDMPSPGTFHPDFLAHIEALPEGVTTGWRRVDGQWLPPVGPETAKPTADQLWAAFLEGYHNG